MSSSRARLVSLVASVALLAPVTVLAGTGPAHASGWTTLFGTDRGVLQMCKTPAGAVPGWVVRGRLHNKRASHAHVIGATVYRGDRVVDRFQNQTGAGRIGKVKSVLVGPSDRMQAGFGELDGRGMGDTIGLGQLTRC